MNYSQILHSPALAHRWIVKQAQTIRRLTRCLDNLRQEVKKEREIRIRMERERDEAFRRLRDQVTLNYALLEKAPLCRTGIKVMREERMEIVELEWWCVSMSVPKNEHLFAADYRDHLYHTVVQGLARKVVERIAEGRRAR